MDVIEFTLHAKPGHYGEVADLYAIAPLLAQPPERVELVLLHSFTRG